MSARDMTVGEIRAALDEYPDYYAVIPIIDAQIGIITAVRQYEVDGNPVVLIGECDLNFNLVEKMHERKGPA